MGELTYFISDLHLGAGYITDHKAHEARVVRWLRSIAPTARRLYLLGDVLDYWYEYREVVPRGFVRFFAALADLVDSGVEVVWFKGNHDIWIFDYLPSELGVKIVDGALITEIGSKKFFLEHGDGVGDLGPTFRFLRGMFRNRLAQRLFSAVHPRWTVAFAHRWSSQSRKSGGGPVEPVFEGENKEWLIQFARDYLKTDPSIDYFVFGHRHLLLDYRLNERSRLIMLGDWITQFSYAVFDGKELTIGRFED